MGKRHGRTVTLASTRARSRVPDLDRPEVELDLLQRLWNFNACMRDTSDPDKVLTAALRLSLDFFAAEQGAIVVMHSGRRAGLIAI